MFFPGTPNIFVPGDSVFMLFKCMCNNILIELIGKNWFWTQDPWIGILADSQLLINYSNYIMSDEGK